MTPNQLRLYAEIFNVKKVDEEKEKITLAYLNSFWTIQWLGKKSQHPKPLKEILGENTEPKKMSVKDMLSEVKKLNAMFGGEVIQ